MSQGGVSYAGIIVVSQVRNRVSDLMEALYPKWRDQLAVLEGLKSVAAVDRRREYLGVGILQAGDDINLLEGIPHAWGSWSVCIHVKERSMTPDALEA